MAITTIEDLKAECTPDVLKAYADEILAQFDKDLDEMLAQVKTEAEPEPEAKPAEVNADAGESDTSDLENRLAAAELALRKADGREVVHAALAEATITKEGKQLLERRFADHAPDDKAEFTKEVAEEVLVMAKHEKTIAESVRLHGTSGVVTEAGETEKVDVQAVIDTITE